MSAEHPNRAKIRKAMHILDEAERMHRVAAFGPEVVLDTDLRKLHSEGRVSDAMRRIYEYKAEVRRDALREAAAIAANSPYFETDVAEAILELNTKV